MARSSWQVPVLAASLVVAPVARAGDDPPPITRDQVMANAAAYAYQTWRAGTANLRAPCDQSWSTDYTAGDYVGLPYNWGGFDDLASFQKKLGQGFGAGAHAEHGVLPCTTGVDCSGFISRVWQLPAKYSTRTLSEVTSVLHDIDDVRPGDAWVKPGSHVVLHAYFRNDGTPAWYEASGGADKVRFMTSGTWAQLDGYQPVRYKGIRETVDVSHAGTLLDPIPISSFPYTDTRNTVLAASDEMDEYPCKVGTSEEGPELVYAADLPSGGKLTATVTHIGGVDLDVHLLSGPGSETCVARADRTLEYEVKTPGRYYLVVDGYSRARDEFSGPYTLDVRFDAPATGARPPTPATLSVATAVPEGGATVKGKVTLTASATAGGSTRLERIELYVDGALVGSSRDSPASVTWGSSTVKNGPHLLTAKAFGTGGVTVESRSVPFHVKNGWFGCGAGGGTAPGGLAVLLLLAAAHGPGRALSRGRPLGAGTGFAGSRNRSFF